MTPKPIDKKNSIFAFWSYTANETSFSDLEDDLGVIEETEDLPAIYSTNYDQAEDLFDQMVEKAKSKPDYRNFQLLDHVTPETPQYYDPMGRRYLGHPLLARMAVIVKRVVCEKKEESRKNKEIWIPDQFYIMAIPTNPGNQTYRLVRKI